MTSQHLHEIEEVSDKLLLLTAGEMKFFGSVDDIGSKRRVNRFELSGDFEMAGLEQALADTPYHSIYYSGVSFVLTTSTAVMAPEVLQRLLDANIRVTYFRDISRSAKSLLQDDGETR